MEDYNFSFLDDIFSKETKNTKKETQSKPKSHRPIQEHGISIFNVPGKKGLTPKSIHHLAITSFIGLNALVHTLISNKIIAKEELQEILNRAYDDFYGERGS